MKSPFRKRLFRLFLLFALIPAIVFMGIGYYLAFESNTFSDDDTTAPVSALAAYQSEFLFEKMRAELVGPPNLSEKSAGMLDVVLRNDDSSPVIVATSQEISDSAIEHIAQASAGRTDGFTEFNQIYYQYVTATDSLGRTTIGVVVHSPAYTQLLNTYEAGLASASSRRAVSSSYLLFLALLLLAVAFITAVVAYFFSSRLAGNLASPLTSLSEASQKIAAGDFKQQVAPEGIGEIRSLIENFNSMARQLRVTTSRLAQTERVAAWRNVARRFAHELKNPLQPIVVSIYRIESALKDSPEYEKLREPLRAASEELKHLTELAERFSQLGKMPPPRLETVDLNETLRSIASLYEATLSDYSFELVLPGKAVTIEADQTYFREAIHNLLKNAADASEKGGRIVLSLRMVDNCAEIVLQDFGQGMSPQVASSARIPYFTTKDSGSGIGLAVVDKIISEIEGSMVIDSQVGRGTTVTITLPLRS